MIMFINFGLGKVLNFLFFGIYLIVFIEFEDLELFK